MELLITECVILWIILWAGALVSLCDRRDIEIHNKVTWIVTVLVLNLLGAILYFVFGPKRQAPTSPECPIDEDAVPHIPEGRSRNPILGENRMPEGQGLNPRNTRSTEQPPAN